MKQIDAIVVGAGIWGCTAARILAEHNRQVLVLERRKAIGGNCRCEIDQDTGIEVHLYGPHIFHTNDEDIWSFINRFTEFNRYMHKCVVIHDGIPYFLPFNLALINQFYRLNLTPFEIAAFIESEVKKSDIQNPEDNFETKAISLVGEKLYNAFIKEYTQKQWGRDPKELPSSIIKRLPVRSSYDMNYYWGDRWQGIPLYGYANMFKSMLNHPNISIELGVDFKEWTKTRTSDLKNVPIFFSGAIDELFDYKYGVLPWRSLKFEFETLDIKDYQGTSIVNYPSKEFSYTRIHEYKHFHPEQMDIMELPKTVICREYPDNWKNGKEAYYPIVDNKSTQLLSLYQEDAKKILNLTIGGRCGSYRYYDMDKAMKNAIDTVNFSIFNQ